MVYAYKTFIGLVNSNDSVNKHKGLGNKGNILRNGDWTVSRRGRCGPHQDA